jgi:hypothetical protein
LIFPGNGRVRVNQFFIFFHVFSFVPQTT